MPIMFKIKHEGTHQASPTFPSFFSSFSLSGRSGGCEELKILNSCIAFMFIVGLVKEGLVIKLESLPLHTGPSRIINIGMGRKSY